MRRVGSGILLACTLAAALPAQSAPPPRAARVSYTRTFPHSVPAFFRVEIYQDGRARFQERDHAGDPLLTLRFAASSRAVHEIFADAAAVDDFSGPLQAKKDNVAYTGTKVLAFDSSTAHHHQTFTYTTLRRAAALVDVFERIGVTGADAVRLRRVMRYQPLDVLDAVHQARDDWDEKQLAEAQLLLPTLNQLISDPGQMKAARDVAQKLAAAIARKP